MSQELIARIEAATGPDRELDVVIQLQVYGDKPYGMKGSYHCPEQSTLAEYHRSCAQVIDADDAIDDDAVPRFSASIDAALTLVQDGWYWQASTTHLGSYGTVMRQTGERANGYAATPALALCAAALKARLAQQ